MRTYARLSHFYGGVSFEQIRRWKLEEYITRLTLLNEYLPEG